MLGERDIAMESLPQSQPHGIPKRIISNTINQSGTQGIGDNVARRRKLIFVGAHRSIMEPALPQRGTMCKLVGCAHR